MTLPQYLVMDITPFDTRYKQSVEPVIVTQIPNGSPEYMAKISKLVLGIHEVDKRAKEIKTSAFGLSATCDCGKYVGDMFIGYKCHTCGTLVQRSVMLSDDDISHKVWIKIPDVLDGGVIHPRMWMILNQWLVLSEGERGKYIRLLEVIIDKTMPIPAAISHIVTGRGWNWLYHNFDRVLDQLSKVMMTTKKSNSIKQSVARAERIMNFIHEHRDRVWVKYIPVMSSILHGATTADGNETAGKVYGDETSMYILSLIHDVSSIEFANLTSRRKNDIDRKVLYAYLESLKYYAAIADKKIATKEAIARQHLAAGRFHWSARAVITPRVEPHRIDELVIPWGVAVNLLSVHATNILIRRYGYTIGEVSYILKRSVNEYSPLMREVFDDLLKECTYKGFPVLFNRNPSIRLGAIQLMFVTEIKNDPTDFTIEFSILSTKDPNADYDGDAMNMFGIIESAAVQEFWPLHISQRLLSLTHIGMNPAISMTPQTAVTISEFLRAGELA